MPAITSRPSSAGSMPHKRGNIMTVARVSDPGSSRGRPMGQAASGLAINGCRRAIEPIERRQPVIIFCGRIGAVFEEDRDRPHETCFGRVVQRRRTPAVVVLTREAPIVRMRAMTRERGDIFGIVLPTLISCAREPDPRSRSIHPRSGAREHRRKLGMENPAPTRVASAPRSSSIATIATFSSAAAWRTARAPPRSGSFAYDLCNRSTPNASVCAPATAW
jgi:hypothetical protein